MIALLRTLRRAAPAAAGRSRAPDRGQRLEPRRPRPARTRDRLPRPPLLARLQPRRQLHRDRGRDPARRARRGRPAAPAPARLQRSCAFLTRRRARGSTGSSPSCPRSARARRPSACWRPARSRSTAPPRPKSHRLAAARTVELDPTGARRAGARARAARRSGSPTRTSTSSSSTSRPGSSSTRARVTPAARSSRACSTAGISGRRPGAARDRPPPRPRHVRPARRRAHRGGLRRPAGRSSGAQAGARVPRARARPAALAQRADRGADRPRPPRARRACRSTPTRPRTAVTHFEVVELVPRPRAAPRPARDRAHAPDPRPPRRDRAARRGRPGLRRLRSRACAASSCTRRGSRSRIRSPGPAVEAESPLPDRPARRRSSGSRSKTPLRCSPFRPTDPAETPGRRCRLGTSGSARARRCSATQTERGSTRGCRLHARAPGGRGPLRPPDPPLEPEDAPVHLHRARRDLHHRPPADLSSCSRRHTSSRRTSPSAAGRSSSSARRSRPRTRSRSRPSASGCRTSTTAGSAAC